MKDPIHRRGFLKTSAKAAAAFSVIYGAVLTEFVLLGNVATQLDRPIEYDPIEMRCVGDDQADAVLRREHREGWKV